MRAIVHYYAQRGENGPTHWEPIELLSVEGAQQLQVRAAREAYVDGLHTQIQRDDGVVIFDSTQHGRLALRYMAGLD